MNIFVFLIRFGVSMLRPLLLVLFLGFVRFGNDPDYFGVFILGEERFVVLFITNSRITFTRFKVRVLFQFFQRTLVVRRVAVFRAELFLVVFRRSDGVGPGEGRPESQFFGRLGDRRQSRLEILRFGERDVVVVGGDQPVLPLGHDRGPLRRGEDVVGVVVVDVGSGGDDVQEVVVLVEILDESRLVLDAVHGVVSVDEQPRESGEPILSELVRKSPVHVFDLRRQLLVVVLFVPDGTQQIADALAVVAASLAEVFGHHGLQQLVPVGLEDEVAAALDGVSDGTVAIVHVHAVADVLQEGQHAVFCPKDGVFQNGSRWRPTVRIVAQHAFNQGLDCHALHARQVPFAAQDVGLPSEAFTERMATFGQDVVINAAQGKDVDQARGRSVAQHHFGCDPAFGTGDA